MRKRQKLLGKQRDEHFLMACMLHEEADDGLYMDMHEREELREFADMLLAETMQTASRPSAKDLHDNPVRCLDDPYAYLNAIHDRTCYKRYRFHASDILRMFAGAIDHQDRGYH